MISFSMALVIIAAMKYGAQVEFNLAVFLITGALDICMVLGAVLAWKEK